MKTILLVKNIVVLLLSLFFMLFGVNILIGSFKLPNPLEFVMVLFGASFIILFCIVGVLYAYFRLFPPKSKDGWDDAETK